MTHCQIGTEIHDFHDEWSDSNIFESITLRQEIEWYKIDKNTENIPFPYMRIIRPGSQGKITNRQKNTCNKCEPESCMHREN